MEDSPPSIQVVQDDHHRHGTTETRPRYPEPLQRKVIALLLTWAPKNSETTSEN